MSSQDDLKKMPVKELRAIAAAVGIDAQSMKKADIVAAILSMGEPAEAPSPEVPSHETEDVKNDGKTQIKQKRTRAGSEKGYAKRDKTEKQVDTSPRSQDAPRKRGRPRKEEVKPEADAPAVTDEVTEKEPSASAGSERKNQPEAKESRSRFQDSRGAQDARNNQRRDYSQNRENRDQERRQSSYPGGNQNNYQSRGSALQPERRQGFDDNQNGRKQSGQRDSDSSPFRDQRAPEDSQEFSCYGIIEINQNGYGFLRAETLYPGSKDIFVAPPIIRRYQLRTGDMINGKARLQAKEYNAQFALSQIEEINGIIAENWSPRPSFDTLVPTYPDERIVLETTQQEYSTRIIDLFAPIGKGQRGLIVSPPKAGKTVLLKKIANAIRKNYPDIRLIMLLIDERPEEVTDIKESVDAMVVASTFDEMTSRHIVVSEFCLEHAERMVEMGEDVVILMDSITRLARAYNQEITPTGRSLSGGLDPGALYKPKKFFGAARNIKNGGSLTIIATALVDTGSRLDDVIYEEFKGTGNMELHLDRSLAERRIFPAIEITLSGTRKEELLLPASTLDRIYALRRAFSGSASAKDITEAVIANMAKTADNKRFLENIKFQNNS